jgi:putative aldouronate transport system permease protein
MRQWELQTMIWPGIAFLILFNVVPLYGLLIAFKKYSISSGILGIFTAPWAGFKYFAQFFTDEVFPLALRNTVAVSLLAMCVSFPAPILFALLLNEVAFPRYKRLVQTVSYLPHFISWVVFAGLVIRFLSPDGLINVIITGLGIAPRPIQFLATPGYFWGIQIGAGIAKNLGYSAIIYIAAISSVDQELYEAAVIDGAGRFRRMASVTLPSISGTIVIMLLLGISGMLTSNFDQVWMLQNNLNLSTSEMIDTYVYKVGIQRMRYSYSTAVGLFQSVTGLVLLLAGNFIAHRVGDKGLF